MINMTQLHQFATFLVEIDLIQFSVDVVKSFKIGLEPAAWFPSNSVLTRVFKSDPLWRIRIFGYFKSQIWISGHVIHSEKILYMYILHRFPSDMQHVATLPCEIRTLNCHVERDN